MKAVFSIGMLFLLVVAFILSPFIQTLSYADDSFLLMLGTIAGEENKKRDAEAAAQKNVQRIDKPQTAQSIDKNFDFSKLKGFCIIKKELTIENKEITQLIINNLAEKGYVYRDQIVEGDDVFVVVFKTDTGSRGYTYDVQQKVSGGTALIKKNPIKYGIVDNVLYPDKVELPDQYITTQKSGTLNYRILAIGMYTVGDSPEEIWKASTVADINESRIVEPTLSGFPLTATKAKEKAKREAIESQKRAEEYKKMRRVIYRPIYYINNIVRLDAYNNNYLSSGMKQEYTLDYSVNDGVGFAVESINVNSGNWAEPIIGLSYAQITSRRVNGTSKLGATGTKYDNEDADLNLSILSIYGKVKYFDVSRMKNNEPTPYWGWKLSYNLLSFSHDFYGNYNPMGYGLCLGYILNNEYDIELSWDSIAGKVEKLDNNSDFFKGDYALQGIISLSVGYRLR